MELIESIVYRKTPMQAAEALAEVYVKLQQGLLQATNRDDIADLAIELRRVIRYAKQNSINREMMNHVALLTSFKG